MAGKGCRLRYGYIVQAWKRECCCGRAVADTDQCTLPATNTLSSEPDRKRLQGLFTRCTFQGSGEEKRIDRPLQNRRLTVVLSKRQIRPLETLRPGHSLSRNGAPREPRSRYSWTSRIHEDVLQDRADVFLAKHVCGYTQARTRMRCLPADQVNESIAAGKAAPVAYTHTSLGVNWYGFSGTFAKICKRT
jgi:hypothetical protein